MSVSAAVPRAPRVTLEAPVLIRRSGELAWCHATSINISRTGVLLQTDGFLVEPQTPVEMVVALPIFGDLAPTRLRGHGRVVRVVTSGRTAGAVLAAHIDDYSLQDEVERPPSF